MNIRQRFSFCLSDMNREKKEEFIIIVITGKQ